MILPQPSGERTRRLSDLATPRATYRVQLRPGFGFQALRETLPYLHGLGISHLYLSPVFRARRGSEHGYDVIDHGELNPELGGEEGFLALAAACRERGMGLLLDIVPNHMAVMNGDNLWWMDVLRHGQASPFARFFDIDWTPARAAMRNRLLVPVLAEPLGEVIDREDLRLVFDAATGTFAVEYGSLAFPLDPGTYARVLDALEADCLPQCSPVAREGWRALRTAFAALPATHDTSEEARDRRDPESRGLARMLASLCAAEPQLNARVSSSLQRISKTSEEGNADLLAALLAAQPYRLAFWRVSGEEINYRRFFDVNDLAALRAEEPDVFEATHALVRRLWQGGQIDGLRVDHADGLYDPAQYFRRLRTMLDGSAAPPPWIVAEKILGPGERLPAGWAVEGTTGYEFAALVAGWMMNPAGAEGLERTWLRFAGNAPPYTEVAWESRRLVMRTSLAAEISGLAARLDRLAQMHRNTQDFTLFDLRQAIVEVIATFPVYRTYISDGTPGAEDAQYIRRAVGAARARKTGAPRALDFLERVLLGELARDPARSAAAREFVLKFQQVTAPVMAKGIEDTAFYRHPCLLAMNEVGGDPLCAGLSTEALHRANEARQRETPRGLLATSTHDTKRGEDPRARLCVLTEVANDWAACAARWRRLKSRRRNAAPVGGVQEYLLLQSLLSIWPLDDGEASQDELRRRMEEYAIKAAREAKDATSWLEPDAEYERVLRAYVSVLLPARADRGFRRYFDPVLDRVRYFGLMNSLVTLVLKLTVPGVPDIYQGNEFPAFVLVDPDNRHTPDYAANCERLRSMQESLERAPPRGLLRGLVEHWRQGDLKMYLTMRLLGLRRAYPDLFEAGDYLALAVEGERSTHLCAFARRVAGCTLIVIVARWGVRLTGGALRMSVEPEVWRDTRVLLPADLPGGNYVDAVTGRSLQLDAQAEAGRVLHAREAFDLLPCCVLLGDAAASVTPFEQQQ